MPCISAKFTEQEIRDILVNKEINKIAELDSALEKARVFRRINEMVETKDIPAENLPIDIKNEIGLKDGETVSRYHLDNHLIATGRTTDITTKLFIKKHGLSKAREMSERVNNIVKARGGEKVHYGAEVITGILLETGMFSNLTPLSEVDGQPLDTPTETALMRELGLSEKNYKALRAGVEKLLSDINKVQERINPNDRAIILPEQFLLNPREDYGGTVDLLVMFSDGTHGVVDYKTHMPPHSQVRGHSNLIIDKNWIPYYKREAFNLQISRLNQTMENFYGSEGTRVSRVAPVHVRFKPKAESQRKQFDSLTEDIGFIDMGAEYYKDDSGRLQVREAEDTFIKHIPVQEKVTLRDKKREEKLNRRIASLSILINNRRKRLEKLSYGTEEYSILSTKIQRNEEAMERLVLDLDFHYLYNGFETVLKGLKKDGRYATLENVDDKEINGQPNPNYLSLEELTNTINDVEAFHNIIESSAYIIEEINPNLSESTYNEYLNQVEKLLLDSSRILEQLREKRTDRELNDSEYEAMKDLTKPGYWARMFRTLGEQVGVPFRKLRQHLNRSQDKKRLGVQTLFAEVKAHNENLKELGKRLNKSVPDLFETMINPKTENLWAKHTKELFEAFEEARNNKNKGWIDQHFQLKDDARETYHRNLELQKKAIGIYDKTPPKDAQEQLDRWIELNNLESVKFTDKWWLYYEAREDIPDQYISDGFKEIRQHKELLDYWNFWYKKMSEFNELLGLKGSEAVPANFLPHIRQDIIGMMSQGTFGLSQLKESVSSIFRVRQDDTGFGEMYDDGEMDPVTGQPRNTVARFFINPIKDAKGNIRRGVKLRDLSKSLVIYGEMAYNYHYLKTEVEPHIEALRDVMVEQGHQQIDESGKKKKFLSGIWARISGQNTDVVKLFDKYVNYHLYGIKIQDAPKRYSKIVGALKSMQSAIELSLSPLLWAGNLGQITSNAYFEGVNGYYYDKKQLMQTMAEGTGLKGTDAKKKYDLLAYLFEFSPQRMRVRQKHLTSRAPERWLNWDTAFLGMRKSEQSVNNNIGISVMKNWTELGGELVRMEDAPEGTKSLYDRIELKDGYLTIEGITDSDGKVTNIDLYSRIRQLAISVATSVKGQLNPDDLATVYTYLAGNAAMGFKTWLPGMADARLSELRYDPSKNRMVHGKWRAFIGDLAKEDRGIAEWLGNTVFPQITRMMANVATFGLSERTNIGKYKVNEARAKRMFEAYQEEHKHDSAIQAMKFEDYIKYKRGQIRATAIEIRTMLALVGMVMAFRVDWDDDGQADWRKNYGTRTLFRILNRTRREVGFLINFEEWRHTIFRAPIPIMSLAFDTPNALWSAMEGVGQFVGGEEPDPRARSKFYPLFRMMPFNKLILFFDPDEHAKQREV